MHLILKKSAEERRWNHQPIQRRKPAHVTRSMCSDDVQQHRGAVISTAKHSAGSQHHSGASVAGAPVAPCPAIPRTARAARRPGMTTLAGGTAAEAASRRTGPCGHYYLWEIREYIGDPWRPPCSWSWPFRCPWRALAWEALGLLRRTFDQRREAHTMG